MNTIPDLASPYAVVHEETTVTEPMGLLIRTGEIEVLAAPDPHPSESTVPSAPPPLPARRPPSSRRIRPPAPTPRSSHPEIGDAVYGALADMALFETAVEGAAYALVTALGAVPSLAGLALLRDPEEDAYVVVYARGPRAHEVVRSRVGLRDGVLTLARLRGAPVSVEYGPTLAPPPRHDSLGDPWNAVVAPVMVGDECLGALELIDPIDGRAVGAAARGALEAITRRLAEFLGDRRVVVKNAFAPEQVGLQD
jgi:hypothetical protein